MASKYKVRILSLFFIVLILGLSLTSILVGLSLIFENQSVGEVSFLSPLTSEAPKDISSPKDRISESDIAAYNDKVVINVKNPVIAKFTPTRSMDPVLDSDSNAIEIIPESYEDIQIGDIVSYHSEITNSVVVHRVVNIGYDSNGIYFTFKGDNNKSNDPERVRFEQIKRIVVGILY